MNYKHNDGVESRIKWLGKMNDRRLQANADNNILELQAIAAEYEARGMLRTAKEIQISIAIRRVGEEESPNPL